jgi:hypothetical protein
VPGEHHRSYLPVGKVDGPVGEDIASGLLGHHMEITLHGEVIAAGTITDVCDADAHLMVTIESGGRMCAACRHVYDDTDAATQLVRAQVFAEQAAKPYPAWAAVYRGLRPWSPACRDWAACEQRRNSTAEASP